MRCTKTRGKKGIPHPDPADPPRRRALHFHGHGTFAHDRPPVLGLVGRDHGALVLAVVGASGRAELEPRVLAATRAGTPVYTDEWTGYVGLSAAGRGHLTVNHNQDQWARDADGDGVREVHCNTLEGIWTGLRNFLRPFRGVSKWYLGQYVAMFEWAYGLKNVGVDLLRRLLGVGVSTFGST
jgi:transposase